MWTACYRAVPLGSGCFCPLPREIEPSLANFERYQRRREKEEEGEEENLKISSPYPSPSGDFFSLRGEKKRLPAWGKGTRRCSFPAGDVRVQISSVAVNLGQLSLHEDRSTNTIEANPSVIIPDHLRVTNADCAHLSFGSFVSGTFSGSFPTKPLKNNLEVAPVVADASMIEDSDAR
ncbi:hypothetical protein B296_00002954 [Ensete ventricosum]|uniref:Uncharacterized protein n=1 Tax=Ensete ventricosum TaxID=4639 RepID=A0A427ABR8_ENSVE|nr:hypothetical protein B296_00002954 [Ensete ventricosum]